MANITGDIGKDTLIGSNGKDTITALDDDDIVDGRGGSDWISGDAGSDSLFGGAGNDTILGGAGADLIYGGGGNELIGASDGSRNVGAGGGSGDVIYGDGYNTFALVSGIVIGQDLTAATQLGDDTIYGTVDADIVYGDNGDNPSGSNVGGADTIYAGSSADVVYGEGGNDALYGEGGDDTLGGGDGKDTLSGGDGNDVITGGAAADAIDGGAGDDRFVYNTASDSSANKIDTIIGFNSGINYASGDKIDIAALLGTGNDIPWNGVSALASGAWYQTVAGGVRLLVDVTGDAVADLEVFVRGAVSLRHSDILGVVNAAPVASNDVYAGDPVVESGSQSAGNPSASGDVLANDIDADGDRMLVTNVGAIAGTYGTFVLDADGSWTYTLDNGNPLTEALKEGQAVAENFSYSVSDGLATGSATLVVSVTGSNDAAIVSGDTVGSTTEAQNLAPWVVDEGDPIASGQLYSVDVDGTANVFQAVSPGTASNMGYGTFEVNATGAWTYTLDNENVAVQALTDGVTATDTFTVLTQDGTSQVVTITIEGRDDAPEITRWVSGSGISYEDTPYVFDAANGDRISLVDPDNAEQTVTLTSAFGTFTLSTTAGLSFTLGDGTSDASMTFSGTIEAVNAALDGMSFTGFANLVGPATMTIMAGTGLLAASQTSYVPIYPVNDAPSGTDATLTTTRNTHLTFAPGDFGFTDVNDAMPPFSSANHLAGIVITTLPSAGTLTNNGAEVIAGQIVSAADLSAGHLQFNPAPDVGGPGYASFTFQVQDDGGTASGGVDLDPTPNTLTIDVLPVNGAPVVTSGATILDPDFGVDGKVTTDVPIYGTGTSMALQTDGKIVVAGIASDSSHEYFALARYDAVGTLDSSFNGDGLVSTLVGSGRSDAYGVAVQSDGKIVAVGGSYDATGQYFAVARYNADGSLDGTFDGDGSATTSNGFAYDVAVQPDGKILVAGTSGFDFAIFRYNVDGSLDSSFGTAGKTTVDIASGSLDRAFCIALQADGRIIVGGSAQHWTSDMHYDAALVRLNADGSPDTSFGGGGVVTTDLGADDFARSVAIQPDGKIIVAGHSSVLQWDTQFGYVVIGDVPGQFALMRYNADGSLDTTFSGDGKLTTAFGHGADAALSVALQDDGKIVAAGSSFNGSNHDFAIARYLSDGSLDGTFDGDGKLTVPIGPYDDYGRAMAIAPDGGIVVAGQTNTFDDSLFSLVRVVDSNGIPHQNVTENSHFQYTFAGDLFTDPDPGTLLSYTASLHNGDPLPTWLHFDAATRTFSGIPLEGDSGELNVKITATDPTSLSASETFSISVTGANVVTGGSGNDVLDGTIGNDILVGGPGNDTLTGGDGADAFKWAGGDQGAGGPAAVDVISDFDPTLAPGTDALDLRDLLVGENSGNLGDYLDFGSAIGDTIISVKSAGSLGAVDQQIVLSGIDLTAMGPESTIIANLLANGKLITD